MYDLCMSTNVPEATITNSIKELKDFMRERGLGWPDLPAQKDEPLGVLLDLAYHWRLGLWFDASHLESTSAADGSHTDLRVLLIEPGAFVGAWAAQHHRVVNEDYSAYWRALERQFSEHPDTPRTDNIANIQRRETEILEELQKVMFAATRTPERFPLSDIQRFTPNISRSVWTEELDKKVVKVEITTLERKPFDNVTVTDTAILRALNTLYMSYSKEAILDHLSWFFVQVFASLADRANLIHKFGSKTRADALWHSYCATEVEASNQFLVAAAYTRLRIPMDARNRFDRELLTVKQAALEKIANNTLTWADDASRRSVAEKVRKQKIILWPPTDLIESAVLSQMYANLSVSRGAFIEFWLDAYKRTRVLLGNPRYGIVKFLLLELK